MAKRGRAALGFCTHTGWAAMLAVAGSPGAPEILLRRKVVMIADGDRDPPRFVYHVARELTLETAARFVRRATDVSTAAANTALAEAVTELRERGYDVVTSGIVAGNRPFEAPLEKIMASHALVHTAEAELFRGVIRAAGESMKIPVVAIPARDLEPRATESFGVSPAQLQKRLAAIGRAAGRPWAKDQKDALLVALLALSASPTPSPRPR